MGYRSDVTIVCEEEAYKMFEKVFKENQDTIPNDITKMYLNKEYVYILKWGWVKWYPSYPDVAAVEDICNQLYEKENEFEGYGFKKIIIGEDNATEETGNDDGYDLFYDFYIEVTPHLPDGSDIEYVLLDFKEEEKTE